MCVIIHINFIVNNSQITAVRLLQCSSPGLYICKIHWPNTDFTDQDYICMDTHELSRGNVVYSIGEGLK